MKTLLVYYSFSFILTCQRVLFRRNALQYRTALPALPVALPYAKARGADMPPSVTESAFVADHVANRLYIGDISAVLRAIVIFSSSMPRERDAPPPFSHAAVTKDT